VISRFSQYLVEEEKVVYFTFGRMNPPTIGHGKLLDKLSSISGRDPYKIFVSQTQDAKKNPLSYSDKIKSVRKMFPKHARSVMINKKVRTAMEAATFLYNQGFRKIVMVVGSDRIREFDVLLNKYNGKDSRHGFYNFMSIKVVSAGERDPDAEGVSGMSASKQRENAAQNDFISFSQGVPSSMNTKDSRAMFNAVRKGMGLKEEKSFKNHVALETVSLARESFVAGTLFELGDSVVVKESEEVCTIAVLGSNYVIVEMSDGKRLRKWLDAVELVESKSGRQPDYGTPESTKAAKKITPGQAGEQTEEGKGLWHNIHQRRKKGLPPKKPGQKGYPKTLNIEAKDPLDLAKQSIDREKNRDAVKHDKILDRARLALAKNKNKETKPRLKGTST